MLNDFIRQTALGMLVLSIKHPYPNIRQRLIESFWDLQYLYKFGIPKVPIPDVSPMSVFKWLPQPQPDSSPIDRIDMHEELLINMLDYITGDTEPYPEDPSDAPSIRKFLNNPNLRLVAAKNLLERMDVALPLLKKEITRLDEQINNA